MKRVSILFVGILAVAFVTGRAEAQTQAERDLLIKHLEKTRATLEEATQGLSPAQWKFKPSVLRWSVAECVEHIALTEDFLFNIITERVMKAPALTTSKDPTETANTDQTILKNIVNRSARFQAPEPVRPKHQTATPQELLSRFFESRKRSLEFAGATPNLRAQCLDSPLGKCTDAYQWLLLLSAHSERHTAQLLEVKADSNFPKQ